MDILWNVLLAVLGTLIVWKSSERLESSSEQIATYHGLPEVVKGAIITAIASSFPELSSVVISTLVHGQFELGISAIVGSAIFNILVIPAASVLLGGKLVADRQIVFKEALFYMIAVSVLLVTLCFAVIYNPVDGEVLQGELTRGLSLIPVVLYAVYIFIQYQDAKENKEENEDTESIRIFREWGLLIICMLFVAGGVELLVLASINLGKILGTPSFLWGLTVIAAGTSLPDLFISVSAAKQGKSITSLSNVLGSNTFDLLIAVPVGVLLAGATVVNFGRAVPMMTSLTFATIVMFVCMRLDMDLNRREAILLLFIYVAFVIWMALEAFGIMTFLGVVAPG